MTRRDLKVEALRKVSLFMPCSDRELKRIASLVDSVEVETGALLTQEGKPGHECFVIAEGEARATLRGKKLADLGPGAIVGEMSLLDGGPRSATLTALTPMKLYVLDGRSFSRLIEEVPSVGRKVFKALAERLRKAEDAPSYTH